MAFVLPNPDYGFKIKQSYISAENAEERFEKLFKPERLSCQALTDKQRQTEMAAVKKILEDLAKQTKGEGIPKNNGGRF